MLKKKYTACLIFMVLTLSLTGQQKTISETLSWTNLQTFSIGDQVIKTLHFSDAINDDAFGMLPVYSRLFPLELPGFSYRYSISNPEFIPFENQDQLSDLIDIELIDNSLNITSDIITLRNKHYSQLKVLPLRRNPQTGLIEKLITFQIDAVPAPEGDFNFTPDRTIYAENSVLAEGDWYKVAVNETGIHRLTYENLVEMGMDFSGVHPDHIRLYGNGGEMLPERNSDPRYDDLQEIAVWVEDGDDGSFDTGDYVLFYAEGTSNWRYVPIRLAFEHIRHLYSDVNYYFITLKEGTGKRIQDQQPITAPTGQVITSYNHFESINLDSLNLIRSGSEWYSHEFSDITSRTYLFEFPYRDVSESVFFSTNFAARSFTNSNFNLNANGEFLFTVPVQSVPPGSVSKFGNELSKTRRVAVPGGQNITIEVTYDKPTAESSGWLNFIEVNVMNKLEFPGGQMPFRNIYTMHQDSITLFQISNVLNPISVWNITDHLNVKKVETTYNEDTCSFKANTSMLQEFIAFDNSFFYQPENIGKIENQNLHALGIADFIIVSHPDFMEQAERLKALHEEIDDMTIHLVSPQEIYTEFSSGKQDPVAIRDFVKMIYDKSGDPPHLKYLLLFGDGSYDPKNRIENNMNFVVTFQSRQSLTYTTSYVTDDFFGLMDPNEGADAVGNVDIGIGRLPVNTPEEAEIMVDKFERYMTLTPENMGHWRQSLCFIADDEDDNLHIFQADTVLVNIVTRNNQTININKIYFDAFKQEPTSGGDRYPDATIAVNQQFNDGALFVNYTGHGGEIALAHERVVQIQDILSWTNNDQMPVFITATCEFAPYDNPGMVSAGEHVVLNPGGGGVGLMSTTRIAFASSNLTLNRRIYDTLFRATPGNYPRLGDLIRFSKTPSSTNIRNFTLLGNPALRLALPDHNIIIDSINGQPITALRDTIRAGSMVSFSGYVATHSNDQLINDYDGFVYPVLYDKPAKITTLANDPKSQPYQFDLQQKILYYGKSSVKDGRFSFSFVVPLEIAYNYGPGKLALYATDSLTDAGGHFSNFIIGGFETNLADQTGPAIDLYLNDKPFINGSVLNNDPVMHAYLSDPSGINAFGAGIGHDIVAELTGPVQMSLILNEQFESDLDNYQSGSIIFPFTHLINGNYSLQLKAWDMLNNSSTSVITFMVSDSISVDLQQVYNYPNPFSKYTEFTFRHNQFDEPLTVEINIYNFNGQLVKTIGPQNAVSNGYYVEPIRWDGISDGGSKLNSGLYVYTIDVINQKKDISRMVQKLIIAD
ncbi:MAG: type IX secretion system sortase PorU [Bacteroidales bacterium]|nr:type IX secretion system sortase PorU [Bacteroidales bacterium]